MNDVAELSGLPSGVAEALAAGTCRDPFAVLGPLDTAVGRVVRVFLPGALQVEVARASGGTLGRLAPTAPPGLFAGQVSSTEPYLLRITWPDTVQETEDPYSFGPQLGDLDLHLFNEGRHFELASHLGANVVTIDGVTGVRFAVGTECACGIRGRRLQYLGPAAEPDDACAASVGDVGIVEAERVQVRHVVGQRPVDRELLAGERPGPDGVGVDDDLHHGRQQRVGRGRSPAACMARRDMDEPACPAPCHQCADIDL